MNYTTPDNARHIYIFVRRDLPFPAIIVQLGHALVEAIRKFLPEDEIHPNFVLCDVHNEPALHKAAAKAEANGIRVARWTEPDMNNSLTAFATEPITGETRQVLRKYQLLKVLENCPCLKANESVT